LARSTLPSFGVFLALAALGACGGSAVADLFAGGKTGQPTDAATPEGDADSDGDVAPADGGGDGATTTDAARREASTLDVDVRDGAAPDSGPPRTLNCSSVPGAVDCSVGSQVCCKQGGATTSYACENGTTCSTSGAVPIPCDDTADCAALGHVGDLCCLTTSSTGRVTEVTCRSQVDCDMNVGRRGLCDPRATDPCPAGGSCKLSTVTLPGFYVCF